MLRRHFLKLFGVVAVAERLLERPPQHHQIALYVKQDGTYWLRFSDGQTLQLN